MNKQEWIIQCNFLKNLMDSYGITVVLPVRIPNFHKSKIGKVLSQIQNSFPDDFIATGDVEYSNLHITLFPIFNSILAFPMDANRNKQHIRKLNQLREMKPDSLSKDEINTFNRLENAMKISSLEVRHFLQQRWNELYDSIKTDLSLQPVELGIPDCKLELIDFGALIISVKDFINEVSFKDVSRFFNVQDRLLLSRFHITLGCVKSLSAYHYLEGILLENLTADDMEIHIDQPEIIAYSHRSLRSILTKIKVSEGDFKYEGARHGD